MKYSLVESNDDQIPKVFTQVQCHLFAAPVKELLEWDDGHETDCAANEAQYEQRGEGCAQANVRSCDQRPLTFSKWQSHAIGMKTNITFIPMKIQYERRLR